MKIQLIVVLALGLGVTSRDYDDDEGRPYEFGFTIDGQQHRHESKDVNGIIMGEFGFITADGIYHVTVYATDENGSFKILSMKNIRVSGPLDAPGYEFPNKISVAQQPQSNPAPATLPTTTLAPTTNYKAPYVFTTLPSLKVPSCSSCKLPSTTARPPGASNKLPFQTPKFQEKKPAPGPNPGPRPNTGAAPNPGLNPNSGPNPGLNPNSEPNPGINLGFKPDIKQPVVQNPSGIISNNPQIQTEISSAEPNKPVGPQNVNNFGAGLIDKRFQNELNKPSIEQQPPFQNHGNYQTNDIPNNPVNPVQPVNPVNPSPFGQTPTHEKLQNPPNPGIQTLPNPGIQIPPNPGFPTPPNPGFQTPPKSPDITVSDQQINIPGKDPIPIKDRFSHMVDGLPNGITENDMLDLLYKFNYTLGFHGHHERGLKNGAKIGAYFVNGRDGIMRVVEYIADENGYRPKVKFINLGLDSPDTPKEGSEKKFGLKGFEFVWYPV